MNIKRRVESLEEKYKPADANRVVQQQLINRILRKAAAREVMNEIADGLVRTKPEFFKRLKSGQTVTDEELLANGIDPERWRRAESKFREKTGSLGNEQA